MRPHDWLLPGAGHVRHGFRRESRKYFLFVGIWAAIVVLRWERIRGLADASLHWDKPAWFWWVLGAALIGSAGWAWRRRAWRSLAAPWAFALAVMFLPWERAFAKPVLSAEWV
ncbi:MAG: hypothetical protein ACE5JG_00155, partial [Planctomycetota bacterium]